VDPGQQVINPAAAASLSAHADALEESARQLRHFISSSQRPDLSEGALRNEDDLAPEHDDG
jgi:hypothetical protein